MNTYDDLRKAAEAATPGPWHAMDELGKSASDHGYRAVVKPHRVSDRQYVYAEAANMWAGGQYGYKWGNDIDFIAIANPATILQLLADLDAAREKAADSILLTGQQLKDALEFVAPDGTQEQLETEVVIGIGDASAHAGIGPYVWLAEYPEEGAMQLFDAAIDNLKGK